jgi:hypothetical protein
VEIENVGYFLNLEYGKVVRIIQELKGDFVRKYGVYPNTIFLGLEQKDLREKSNSFFNEEYNSLYGMKLRYVDEINHLSVGLVMEQK